jgi:hypothetical protein
VAVLVIGWLGVEREARRLERADLLNPDPTWRLNLGLAMVDRNPRRAVRELQGVVTSESDNLIAWKILRFGARPVDRRLAARARAEVERLDPMTEREARRVAR